MLNVVLKNKKYRISAQFNLLFAYCFQFKVYKSMKNKIELGLTETNGN